MTTVSFFLTDNSRTFISVDIEDIVALTPADSNHEVTLLKSVKTCQVASITFRRTGNAADITLPISTDSYRDIEMLLACKNEAK